MQPTLITTLEAIAAALVADDPIAVFDRGVDLYQLVGDEVAHALIERLIAELEQRRRRPALAA
jgi:hypothetical protein